MLRFLDLKKHRKDAEEAVRKRQPTEERKLMKKLAKEEKGRQKKLGKAEGIQTLERWFAKPSKSQSQFVSRFPT